MGSVARATGPDAHTRRTLSELGDFTGWLSTYGVRGYVGEVGWPDDAKGDASKWNRLADTWFRRADRAGLWVTVWAAGEWWRTGYLLAPYEGSSGGAVDRSNTQACVIERHPGPPASLRGVSVAGGEFGAPEKDATSSFSNRNPGSYNVAYHFDTAATFAFLAGRGIRLVRIPFRWERLQPQPGGALDRNELRRIKAVAARAHHTGLLVVLDMHNFGAYYLSEGRRGVRRAIGSNRCTIADFADVWRRISRSFHGVPGIVAYGLMNEPVGLPVVAGSSPAEVWRRASQAAVSAIRRTGDRTLVMVSGYGYAGTHDWKVVNPRPWIHDPAHHVRYEAHHYFDIDHSGSYAMTYDEEEAALGG